MLQSMSSNMFAYMQVDVLTWRSKHARIHAQIKDICAILSGLVVAQDYRKGQELVTNRDFADNAAFFQVITSACLMQLCCNTVQAITVEQFVCHF